MIPFEDGLWKSKMSQYYPVLQDSVQKMVGYFLSSPKNVEGNLKGLH